MISYAFNSARYRGQFLCHCNNIIVSLFRGQNPTIGEAGRSGEEQRPYILFQVEARGIKMNSSLEAIQADESECMCTLDCMLTQQLAGAILSFLSGRAEEPL